jgi:hypothetical protein
MNREEPTQPYPLALLIFEQALAWACTLSGIVLIFLADYAPGFLIIVAAFLPRIKLGWLIRDKPKLTQRSDL